MIAEHLRSLMLILLVIPVSINATTIVDTGEGTGLSATLSGDPVFGQYFAGQITLNSRTELTDVEGWLSYGQDQDGNGFTVSIFEENGGFPDPSGQIYSGVASVNVTDFSTFFTADWQGVNNVSWLLDPGIYWITLEVRSGQSLEAGLPNNAPNPLALYAHKNPTSPVWGRAGPGTVYEYGFRVSGNVVPIPASIYLFGSGILLLFSRAFKHQSKFADD